MNRILLALLFSCNLSAMDSNLELSPGSGIKKVRLPFEYAHLSNSDKNQVKFIHERFYTILSDESPEKAIVGPLQPCVFIGLRNNENGRAIVFHKHFSNSVEDLVNVAKKELNITDSKNVIGRIFTTKMVAYETPMQGYFGITTMKAMHNGKSQLEELKFIKDSIITAFNIEDRNQIKAEIFTSKLKDFELGDYEMAELSVFVDSKLNMKSVCIMHEGIFGKCDNYPLSYRVQYVRAEEGKKKQELLMKHFSGKTNNESLNTYNKVNFEKL